MRKRFYLKHKDDIVALVLLSEASKEFSKCAIVNQTLLPIGVTDEISLKKWWLRRAVPRTQDGMQKMLNEIGSPHDLLFNNLGLSLTDHYWVCPVDVPFYWKQVSLYHNPFSEVVYDDSRSSLFEFDNLIFSPASSLQGELRKKWIQLDNSIWLAKGNWANGWQQSVNECFASLIHKKQDSVSFAEYKMATLEWSKGSELGCISRNFTSENLELVPAIDVFLAKNKPNEVSGFEHIIAISSSFGVDEVEVRKFLEYQIIVDFIITNEDRHLNNFGFLRDSQTMKLLYPAPIFDSGNSMFWRRNFPKNDYELLLMEVNSFASKEIKLLQYVTDFSLVDIKKLPNVEEVTNLYKKCNTDTSKAIQLYEKKVEILVRLQNGESINKIKEEARRQRR